ncbi:MAG: helix-turn-helix transcriptional regulator [bacterium]|nr:helix-turn-helix transcriptional regulator [bacterium]
MQDKKEIILNVLAEVVKDLRGKRSQFMFASENDISTSIISMIERGLKDPQLTTLMKLAEAFDMKFSDFAKLIEEKLPDNFSLIEK